MAYAAVLLRSNAPPDISSGDEKSAATPPYPIGRYTVGHDVIADAADRHQPSTALAV
jgi:hypothetical protein